MSNLILSANQWPKILAFIRECPRVYVGEEAGCNRFIEAVLWVMRSGGQWRQLPAQYGKWNTVINALLGMACGNACTSILRLIQTWHV